MTEREVAPIQIRLRKLLEDASPRNRRNRSRCQLAEAYAGDALSISPIIDGWQARRSKRLVHD